MSEQYNYDDNFLIGLSFVQAFFSEDDESIALIEKSVSSDSLKQSLLQVVIIAFLRLRQKEGISEQEIIDQIRTEFLEIKSQE